MNMTLFPYVLILWLTLDNPIFYSEFMKDSSANSKVSIPIPKCLVIVK